MRHKAREMLVGNARSCSMGCAGIWRRSASSRRRGRRTPMRSSAILAEAATRTARSRSRLRRRLWRRSLRRSRNRRCDRRIDETSRVVKKDETARRLMTIPGFGPITASAMAASVQDASAFEGPREFAAFLGLTPRQSSTGGKERLGRITKMGDRYLRKLLVVGACATLIHRKGHHDALRIWADRGWREGGQIQVQADGGGAGQQGGAHRLRADDARRPIQRTADRGLRPKSRQGEAWQGLSPRGDKQSRVTKG